MKKNKVACGLLACGLLMSLGTLFTPQSVLGQITPTATVCPMLGGLHATFSRAKAASVTDEMFIESIEVRNASQFFIGGVTVGVAFFVGEEMTPRYWTVLPGQYVLRPNGTVAVPVMAGLEEVPPGEYKAKAFAVQGNAVTLLGTIMADSSEADEVTLTKTTTSQPQVITVSPRINGITADDLLDLPLGTPINLEITTQNNGEKVLSEGYAFGVISAGAVPLGGAIRASAIDPLKLLPGSSRVTKLSDGYTGSGAHSIYTGLMVEGVMQPLSVSKIVIGGEEESASFPYVSSIGSTEYPLQADADLVACVGYTNSDKPLAQFPELLGINFVGKVGDKEVFDATAVSTDMGGKGYFVVRPGVVADELDMNVNLLRRQNEVWQSPEADETDREQMLARLSPVANVSLLYWCPEGEDWCRLESRKNDGTPGSAIAGPNLPSPWFYVSVIIAAALLGALMYQRRTKRKQEKMHVPEQPKASSRPVKQNEQLKK